MNRFSVFELISSLVYENPELKCILIHIEVVIYSLASWAKGGRSLKTQFKAQLKLSLS